ncbi:MAG: hypothetical protein NT015_11640 [Alphaproteobacteria bacterium]|nr:hypothetical protein [Alphaproteobacteria bacterium]
MTKLANFSRIALAALAMSAVLAEPASAQRWRRAPQNVATTTQVGQANAAGIAQNGQANNAGVAQFGSNNTGTVQQNGNNNTGCVIQFGRNNDAALAQTGDSNSVAVVQGRGQTRIMSGDVCTRGFMGIRVVGR